MVPTITRLVPDGSACVYSMLLRIDGTGFNVATQTSDRLFHQTVFVTVDGVDAPATCFDATLITFLVPDLDPGGPYDVVVQNLDQTTGDPIPGEAVTLARAVTVVLPALGKESETGLTRVVRSFVRLLKRQLVAEVDPGVQTDYDAVSGDQVHVAQFASLPAIGLVGPELVENRFYSLNDQETNDAELSGDPQADFVEARVPYTVDLTFDVIGASDNKVELLNLMSNFIAVMHKNKKLAVLADGDDPSGPVVLYEMDFVEGMQPKRVGSSNNSNLLTWSSQIVIRGVDVMGVEGVSAGETGGVPNQMIVSTGKEAEEIVVAPPTQGV
jgi:hypothetical protein